MPREKAISEPVEVPDVDEDATPMERLTAFARRIVRVPKKEIDARDARDKDEQRPA